MSPSSRFVFLPALLAAAVIGGPAQAQVQAPLADLPPVRTGAWDVLSSAPGQPAVGYQLCFRNGDGQDIGQLLPHLASGAAGCDSPTLRLDEDTLSWSLQCPAAHLYVNARYKLTAQRIDGEVNITSGSPPQSRTQSIHAHYAGACPAP
jgi:hypothetical protein